MKIGIIAAMSKELQLLLPLMNDVEIVEASGFRFHIGTIGSASVVAMQCGIGKVNASVGCVTMIDMFHPDMVINTGVAGGTGSAAGILDIVVAEAVAYHDVWCGPGTQWGEAAGCPGRMETDARLLALECLNDVPHLHKGLIASGDIFVDRASQVEHILSLYPDAMAVDMESGALAQTCRLRAVPFFCFRVVSDTPGAGVDNAAQYEHFWEDAPKSAFGLLSRIIGELTRG